MAFLNREREGKVDDIFSFRHGSKSGEGKRRLKKRGEFLRGSFKRKAHLHISGYPSLNLESFFLFCLSVIFVSVRMASKRSHSADWDPNWD